MPQCDILGKQLFAHLKTHIISIDFFAQTQL